MKNVSNKTRAPKKGMAIFCPSCSKANIVYQFNWKSLECPNCHGRFEKFQYLLDENLNDIANNIRKQLLHYLDYLIMTSLIDRMPNKSVIEQLWDYFDNLHDYHIVNDFETRGANLKGKNCITPKMPDAVYRSWVLDKYELFELQKSAVRDVPYDEQENFYLGITSDSSEESLQSTSSAVEW